MTALLSDYYGHSYPLSDPEQAGEMFEDHATAIMPSGTSGQVIWLGSEDNQKILRIGIDIDEGRAALRWLPDGTHAVELEPGPAIETYETQDGGRAYVPGTLARVSPGTARAAVAEFVATGKRPTCVSWEQ